MLDLSRPHRRRLIRVIVVAEVVVAMVTAITVAVAYRTLDSNIEALPEIPHVVAEPMAPTADDGDDEEPAIPLNILIMGSDTRAGAGNRIDGESDETERSDTTILLHVSADRQTAYGVSVPRDAMVSRPSCEARDTGERLPPEDTIIWNDAFMVGGPLCTVRQFEHVTGIYVNHSVVVDFNGFKDMVDAVHGVEVCIPKDVVDPEHDIYLDAGRRLVTGQEALNYVRERTVLSANGDIGRMKRQQAFVASMANRVLSSQTLTSPRRIYSFLKAATGSVQLDEDLDSLGELADLAVETRAIEPDRIRFVSVPTEAYAPDPNRLQITDEAEELWKLVRQDEPLGRFGKSAIAAGDDVGQVDGDDSSAEAQERRANGLCS